MADKGLKGEPDAEFAKRIDPMKDPLTEEQIQFIRKVELERWKKNAHKLRGRNVVTGLAIGALVMGIFCKAGCYYSEGSMLALTALCSDGYTFYSVSQERIMDELDEEAKVARTRAAN